MPEYYKSDEKIECKAADVFAKKIVTGAILNHPKIGRHRKYTCKRDGSAEIIKELNPKAPIINKNSKLDKGSKIRCESFLVLVKGMKSLKILKKGGYSGRHSSQNFKTNVYTFAEVTVPFNHIQKAIEKAQEKIEK